MHTPNNESTPPTAVLYLSKLSPCTAVIGTVAPTGPIAPLGQLQEISVTRFLLLSQLLLLLKKNHVAPIASPAPLPPTCYFYSFNEKVGDLEK